MFCNQAEITAEQIHALSLQLHFVFWKQGNNLLVRFRAPNICTNGKALHVTAHPPPHKGNIYLSQQQQRAVLSWDIGLCSSSESTVKSTINPLLGLDVLRELLAISIGVPVHA